MAQMCTLGSVREDVRSWQQLLSCLLPARPIEPMKEKSLQPGSLGSGMQGLYWGQASELEAAEALPGGEAESRAEGQVCEKVAGRGTAVAGLLLRKPAGGGRGGAGRGCLQKRLPAPLSSTLPSTWHS